MRGPAASRLCPRRVDCCIALLDVDDLSFLVHDEGRAIRHTGCLNEYAVRFRYRAIFEIAQHRYLDFILGCELPLGKGVVGTDSKNLSVGCVEFSDTSLVRRKFLRSTTGKCGRIEREDNDVLAAKIAQLYRFTGGGRQSEVRRHIA